MENVNANQVDSTTEASSPEGKQNDTVSYDSFRKSVEAEKRAREKAQQLEAELEAKKQAELEAQGKHQEIIDSLKNKLFEVESTLKKERESNLWDKVTSAVKTEAVKNGCTDPDKLIKLFDRNDFSILQAENGHIRPESLGALMEKAKKENYFLFNKGEVRVNDAVPASTSQRDQKVDTSKMTPNELAEFIRNQYK